LLGAGKAHEGKLLPGDAAKWPEFLATVREWYVGTFAPEDGIEG